jgi:hypothetical protein
MTEKPDKTMAVCAECDRETDNYNTFLSSTNDPRVVCWECTAREEKGFNTKRDFHRDARSGVIPR